MLTRIPRLENVTVDVAAGLHPEARVQVKELGSGSVDSYEIAWYWIADLQSAVPSATRRSGEFVNSHLFMLTRIPRLGLVFLWDELCSYVFIQFSQALAVTLNKAG